MKIYSEKNICFGTVGKPTNLIDDSNNNLCVGDIVLVTHKTVNWQRLCFVCQYKDEGEFYIPGRPHIRPEDSAKFLCEKVLDFSKIKAGLKIASLTIKE